MSESRFYVCEKCGNTVGMIHDKGVPLMCCGRPMTHLKPERKTLNIQRKKTTGYTLPPTEGVRERCLTPTGAEN